MSAALGSVIDARSGQAARREHILDAAEACFVRNGFHRTTMQDLAREASMSPGNIYRYFESKEAVVLGLAERERAGGLVLVQEMERSGDRRGALAGILARYFEAVSRESATLRLDIWTEATRNPAIAAMVARGEEEARAWFVETLAALAAPGRDAEALYAAMNPLMKGIIVNKALVPDYDTGPAVTRLRAMIEAELTGTPAASDAETGR